MNNMLQPLSERWAYLAGMALTLFCLSTVSLAQASDSSAFKQALNQMQQAPVQHVTVGDIKIAYKTFGEGEPLFAITGNGDTMDLWSPLFIQGLASQHKVYIFDNRGAGLTTSGTQPFTIEQFAKDTAGFMSQMGYDKAKVLGFSMGSRIALQLTINQPAVVEKSCSTAARQAANKKSNAARPCKKSLPTPQARRRSKSNACSVC
jgi:pimeloyl-ACP methyl ester carboxylesterase